MHNRQRFAVAVLLAVAGLSTARPAFAQFPFFGGKDFKQFADRAGRFQLEYPKDWQATIGVGDVIVTFTQKKGEAALVIQRFQLLDDPGQITDTFGQVEMDSFKMQQPQATDVSFKIAVANGRPVIVIDYSRQGLAGQEKGRQYSFPVGSQIFRLNCTAMMSLFAKYEPQFLHIAQSFMTGSGSALTPAANPSQTK